ncbi:MAG: MBG-2 domain-containing protein, partial [Chthoniobacterales bacterium]|nr:MBG-2 domain-containing protein [Chthoniobacterales bacterium]
MLCACRTHIGDCFDKGCFRRTSLTIGARPATVKADDKSKTYGNLNPALTAMVAGTV